MQARRFRQDPVRDPISKEYSVSDFMFHGWHEENIRNRRERFAAPGSNVDVQKGPRVMNPKETNVELIPMSVRRNIQNVQDIQDHSSDPKNVCSRKICTQGSVLRDYYPDIQAAQPMHQYAGGSNPPNPG